ncbi:hypothetical protein T10_9008 [Trichinella papuae]|uniref:Uncharacterized protein n=1 Tax=Trichinella papuae TaxID=268474 RepID=A0A0V1N780_9BILA|nr:hypothetical protein T10_9008 [Trichinella papuae]
MTEAICTLFPSLVSITVHNRCLKILKQGPHHSVLKTAETPAAMAVDLNVSLAMLREQQKRRVREEKQKSNFGVICFLAVFAHPFQDDCITN